MPRHARKRKGPKQRKLLAEHVRIDRQGYDRHGRYWGTGEKLYRVSEYETGEDDYVRAPNAITAKALTREKLTRKAEEIEYRQTHRGQPGYY